MRKIRYKVTEQIAPYSTIKTFIYKHKCNYFKDNSIYAAELNKKNVIKKRKQDSPVGIGSFLCISQCEHNRKGIYDGNIIHCKVDETAIGGIYKRHLIVEKEIIYLP